MKLKILLLLATLLVAPVAAKDGVLELGSQVPNFQLVNQQGQTVTLADFKGKGIVVSFLYTRCPYPDKCPMIGRKLDALSQLSSKIGRDNDLQILAVTLDPTHDKPEVLKAYARGFDKDHKNWSFLTGSESDIARVAGAFGVIYWEEKGVIEHNLRTVFIDSAGKLRIVKKGSDWKAGEFAAEIKPFLR